jgi:NADH:ubiquinone oxidoreductase subunit K
MNIMIPSSYSIFILVLGACEARLGLSILINVTRFKGNDMITLEALKY